MVLYISCYLCSFCRMYVSWFYVLPLCFIIIFQPFTDGLIYFMLYVFFGRMCVSWFYVLPLCFIIILSTSHCPNSLISSYWSVNLSLFMFRHRSISFVINFLLTRISSYDILLQVSSRLFEVSVNPFLVCHYVCDMFPFELMLPVSHSMSISSNSPFTNIPLGCLWFHVSSYQFDIPFYPFLTLNHSQVMFHSRSCFTLIILCLFSVIPHSLIFP